MKIIEKKIPAGAPFVCRDITIGWSTLTNGKNKVEVPFIQCWDETGKQAEGFNIPPSHSMVTGLGLFSRGLKCWIKNLIWNGIKT